MRLENFARVEWYTQKQQFPYLETLPTSFSAPRAIAIEGESCGCLRNVLELAFVLEKFCQFEFEFSNGIQIQRIATIQTRASVNGFIAGSSSSSKQKDVRYLETHLFAVYVIRFTFNATCYQILLWPSKFIFVNFRRRYTYRLGPKKTDHYPLLTTTRAYRRE